MEFSHKKITDAEIHEKEKALAEEITALVSDFSDKFASLGYELDTEFSRENENLKEEEAEALGKTDIKAEAANYKDGYISGVKITVKRNKTEEELAKEAEEAEENAAANDALLLDTEEEYDEEAEQLKDDLILEKAKRELERSVAFTSMFLVKVYKTFWHETVSISEGTDEIRADLEEFFGVLAEKAAE